mmetsp:Transcript_34412/g.79567  ORF Transcript_34412/g.79567 Transcript_34412/m.79567 type:complete len:95 (-) Transcript_34412:1608-1892(-)
MARHGSPGRVGHTRARRDQRRDGPAVDLSGGGGDAAGAVQHAFGGLYPTWGGGVRVPGGERERISERSSCVGRDDVRVAEGSDERGDAEAPGES